MKLQDNRPWIEGRPSKDEGGTSKVAGKPSGVDSEAGLVVPVGIQSLVPSPEILIRSEWINKTGVSTGEAGSMCLLPGRRIDPKPPAPPNTPCAPRDQRAADVPPSPVTMPRPDTMLPEQCPLAMRRLRGGSARSATRRAPCPTSSQSRRRPATRGPPLRSRPQRPAPVPQERSTGRSSAVVRMYIDACTVMYANPIPPPRRCPRLPRASALPPCRRRTVRVRVAICTVRCFK